MARLRYNGLSTTLGGSGLTSSATSATFAAALTHSGGTNVPTISGTNYIPLAILDSNGKLSEVVYLTAYTAAATTGTIVRGMEGTTGVSHALGDKVICGPTLADVTPGSADPQPAAPNAKDDEFDGSSSVSWTSTPTAPNTWDINTTRPHHAYLKTSAAAAVYVGKYQAVPGSYPYTITAKVTGSTNRALYQRGGGLMLGPASPTNSSTVLYFGSFWNSGETNNIGGHLICRQLTTLGGTFASIGGQLYRGHGPWYLRLVVASATSVSMFSSVDGWTWMPHEAAFNPGFTPGIMGVIMNDETANSGVEAYFDFFRVT